MRIPCIPKRKATIGRGIKRGLTYTLMCIGFFWLPGAHAQSAFKLYLIANPLNVGEVDQVKGVEKALAELSSQHIACEFLNAKDIRKNAQTISKELKANQRIMVVGAGEEGAQNIQALPSHPNLIVCLTSHMLLQAHKNPALLEKVDFIALPSHVPFKDKANVGSKLIETIGVSHNRTPQGPTQTYQKHKRELPLCTGYLGVILGGDAPAPESGIKRFTKEDAVNLANDVAALAKKTKACVLVLNGPRTGKYDKHQKEIVSVPRKGYSDPITTFFVQTLEERGIHATLFDFQHKTPDNMKWVRPYDTFDLVVGALRLYPGVLLVPGDSTSMISEAIDVLTPSKVLIYRNSAMNAIHEAHVISEYRTGRAGILGKGAKLPDTRPKKGKSAAKIIAQRLLEASQTQWK